MQAIRLQKKYPEVSQDEMFDLISRFNVTGPSGRGESYDRVRETLKHVSVDASGKVELEDWVELNVKLRSQTSSLTKKAGKVTVQGSNANVSHTINEDERREFTNHINGILEGDADVGSRIPIPTETMQLFDEARDGLILCKLINDSVPDTIDMRVLNKPTSRKALNAFQITENNNIVITSAKAIGCSVVNIGSSDIATGTEHLILGLIWQIIRRGLLAQVDIKLHPELYRLCEEGETIDDLLRLTPDQLLLRWFNYHLKQAGWHRRVNNFSKDVSDGENYTVLLNQLKPDECSRSPLQTRDLRQRAEQVLQNADRIGCRKYLSPASLIAVEDFDAEGEREARVFTLWLNSLGVEPPVFNLFENLRDGLVLLYAFDKVYPGVVVWRRVSKPKGGNGEEEDVDIGVTPNQSTLSKFKQVENTNYCIELGSRMAWFRYCRQKENVGLGYVWQLMRMSITKTLSSLSKSGQGRPISDTEMLRWANTTAQKGQSGTKSIRSFKDPSITTGIKPGIVDPSLVYNISEQGDYEERRQNGVEMAISIARKMNALIFLVPEDIVDVRPRLILTFVGSLMSVAQQ
ncbi:calponin homology domain-containing protein [Russula vinacea]|nr:calponin homology domain-containing protein [Russula vinacea]